MASDSSIIFITGGVRSGKSRFAEKTAATWWQQSPTGTLHYIATMQATDSEMEKRIDRHKKDRTKGGLPWRTWEKPVSVGDLAYHFRQEDIVLLDCLTTWLNNEFFFASDDWKAAQFHDDLFDKMWYGIDRIRSHVNKLIIVSNEVLHEPLANNELVLAYSRILGLLHRQIVTNAYQAILIEAGTPIFMKEGEER
ncbi:bifunctional adenosylcobinamide kinase/adenosylcobinamide-phosphate guanylyltransferase [Caldifermentibacillus hisashii]|uniref:bifunctional adenosylcobinamide kinase/adenosylcobinamide-phosphate guanylyltransferase n=1 Tax=Caldifermentibacillus hisashii TaxID=996558 RepID=UPI003444C283